jgi:hypothetical protein
MKFMEMDIREVLMKQLQEGNSEEDEPRLELPFAAQDLRDGLTALMTSNSFKIGDIVRQKPTCTIYRERYPGEPAIVCEILPEPIVDGEQSCSSAYFRACLTMIIGRRGPDGDFNTFHIDGRRFELVPRDELILPGDE